MRFLKAKCSYTRPRTSVDIAVTAKARTTTSTIPHQKRLPNISKHIEKPHNTSNYLTTNVYRKRTPFTHTIIITITIIKMDARQRERRRDFLKLKMTRLDEDDTPPPPPPPSPPRRPSPPPPTPAPRRRRRRSPPRTTHVRWLAAAGILWLFLRWMLWWEDVVDGARRPGSPAERFL